MALGPLATVDLMKSIDVSVNVSGGGGTRSSGAIRHGLSRALEKMNGDLRSPLKKAGHLRRDREKSKGRKPGNRGQGKGSILQKINLIQKSFTKPLGTPTEGFVFFNFK